jgi:hypothetical protein
MSGRFWATIVLGCAAAGCVHTGFAGTTAVVVPARSPDCHLDVFFEGAPPAPYAVLGGVATVSTKPRLFAIGESSVVAVRRLMEQACAVGAHGLMNVAAQSELVRVRKGYRQSTTGSAVAFVYVDPSGRPLPPPAASAGRP